MDEETLQLAVARADKRTNNYIVNFFIGIVSLLLVGIFLRSYQETSLLAQLVHVIAVYGVVGVAVVGFVIVQHLRVMGRVKQEIGRRNADLTIDH